MLFTKRCSALKAKFQYPKKQLIIISQANRFHSKFFAAIIESSFSIPVNSLPDINFQSDANNTSKPSLLAWFLTPLTQNLQINPQTLQNRVIQFKEALKNLGLGNRNDSKGKQLNNANNLLHVASVSDSGFYTDRLEPAGFFGGNGWLANKGGILGRPGAILSTGSILTDYPSAYRRK